MDLSAVTPQMLEDEDVLVTKWVIVAEVITEEGKRDVRRQWSDTCEMWDVEGLLNWGLSGFDGDEDDG